jgi:hypothetical protein
LDIVLDRSSRKKTALGDIFIFTTASLALSCLDNSERVHTATDRLPTAPAIAAWSHCVPAELAGWMMLFLDCGLPAVSADQQHCRIGSVIVGLDDGLERGWIWEQNIRVLRRLACCFPRSCLTYSASDWPSFVLGWAFGVDFREGVIPWNPVSPARD